jgi:hypothetical protein
MGEWSQAACSHVAAMKTGVTLALLLEGFLVEDPDGVAEDAGPGADCRCRQVGMNAARRDDHGDRR